MRTWFWTLLLATVAVALAVALRGNAGNVIIVVNTLRIEVSLAFAVFALIAAFAVLYVLLRMVAWITALPERMREWKSRRNSRRDGELLEQGWTELLEGRYAHAEKDLTRLLDRSRDSSRQVLAALSAARAAHALGEFDRRDSLIAMARQKAAGNSGLSGATATAAADLYLDQGLAQTALDELLPLEESSARHVHTMRLLLRAYRQLGRHDEVYSLATALQRRGALHESEARPMIEAAAAARLRALQTQDEWHTVWKSLKSDERKLPEVALAGAAAFEAAGMPDEASRALEQAISVGFDPRLLAAYARCDPGQVARRLEKAEGWLEQRPEDPDLLTTLGNLCLSGQIWGQADHYLQRSLARRADARVHALLGSLYDRLGRTQDAARQWRLATAIGTALPVLVEDSALPAAAVHADPGVRQAEGLAYMAETGLPIVAQDAVSIADRSGEPISHLDRPAFALTPAHDFEEFFDSAPVNGLGEPAAVSPAPVPAREPGSRAYVTEPGTRDSGTNTTSGLPSGGLSSAPEKSS